MITGGKLPTFPYDKLIPEDIKELTYACMQLNFNERPEISEICDFFETQYLLLAFFITSEGKFLSYRSNHFVQLLTAEPDSNISTPIETTIRGGASFCIAGDCKSFIFVGTEPPVSTPNRHIKEKVGHVTSP